MAENRTFSIDGMTCDHCARTLERALGDLPGVQRADVSFPERRATIDVEAMVDDAAIVAAAESKGFRARRALLTASPPRTQGRAPGPASFDLVILGSGGAAFGAALRAAELGAKVAMVERSTLGGTCVNVGCVPSKTLIRAAESVHRAQRTPFAGVAVQGQVTRFAELMEQADSLVSTLRQTKYADVLRSTPNVTLFEGHGRFASRNELQVGGQVLRSERFIIATGARPHAADIPGLEAAGYLTSTTALSLRELPSSLIVLGGRYIALELAQAFARLGSKVTILQRSSHILPTEDDDVTETLATYLREEGIEVLSDARTLRVDRDGPGYRVDVEVAGVRDTRHAAQLLAATGRRPNTDDLGLDQIGVSLRADGHVGVDDALQTIVPGIFAAGDVIGDPAFVYTAAYEGRLAAENALTGHRARRDYTVLPWVMFTDPQVAVVGLNEKRARAEGIAVDVAKLPMTHVPRSLAARDTRGFIKLIKERGGDRLLGAAILAPEAGDLIMEPALAIRHGIGVSELATAFHPYLTQIEGIKLAAQTFSKDVSKLSCCAA